MCKKTFFSGYFLFSFNALFITLVAQMRFMDGASNQIIVFLLVSTGIILLLALLTIALLYLHMKRRYAYEKSISTLNESHEKAILKTQVEIQEQTFYTISREIHDNINLNLTLAKLRLNTIDWNNMNIAKTSVSDSIDIVGTAINDLSDLSRSMNSEVIKHMGLINALQKEIKRIEAFTRLKIDYTVTGEPTFMACEKELFIFRMIQEAFNNVLKHAKATIASLSLNYSASVLKIIVKDDGSGFDKEAVNSKKDNNAGLKNMEARAKLFNGDMALQTCPGKGTEVYITIPI